MNKSKGTKTGQCAAWVALAAGLLFAFPAAYPQAPPGCASQAAVKDWAQQGNDPQCPFDKRRNAFEQALAACPSRADLYNGLAVLLLQHRDFDLALQWIRRGLQVAPTDSGLKLDLGVALLATGRTPDALTLLQQLPSGPQREFYLGMAYRSQGNHGAARQALAKAFAQGYEDPYVLYALIEQERLLGEKEAGLEHFRIFDQRFPNSPFLHLLLGDAYLFKDSQAEAENEYRQALGLDPNLPVVNFRLGYVEFKNARYPQAAEFFRKEIELSPAFADSYLYLGASLHRLGRNEAALPFLQQAVTRNPHSHLAYRELAAVQLEANHADAAMQLLRTAVKLLPDDQSLHAQLAQLLTKQGQLEEARKEAQVARQLSGQGVRREQATLESLESASSPTPAGKSLDRHSSPTVSAADGKPNVSAQNHARPALEPVRECLARSDVPCATAALSRIHKQEFMDNPAFLELQARTLALQHKYSDALTTVQRAIQGDPHQVRYLLFEGELQQRLGDQLSAMRAFLQAHELEPRSPVPLYSIGMSLFALGFYENDSTYYGRAGRHFRLALELDPRFGKAEFMQGVIEVVKFALPNAKPHYEKAIEIDPRNPYYHLHYGVLLSRLGDSSQALQEIGRAAQLDPNYALTHFSLGNLYSRMGRYERARDELELAVKLNPRLENAFYSLGNVYRHLGLKDTADKAFANFESVRQQKNVTDPVEATLFTTNPPSESEHP